MRIPPLMCAEKDLKHLKEILALKSLFEPAMLELKRGKLNHILSRIGEENLVDKIDP